MKCQHTFFMENPYFKINGGKRYLEIPCGKCYICRLNKTNEVTEQLWKEFITQGRIGVFITLTYSDISLKEMNRFIYKDGQLVKGKTKLGENIVSTLSIEDYQLFLKRLRRNLERDNLYKGFKYVICGEYGGKLGRAHYHLALLGYGLEISKHINNAWTRKYNDGNRRLIGLTEIKPITSKGAFRYILKYIEKEQGERNYYEQYEEYGIEKPFHRMSKGMGVKYYETHIKEIINNNGTVIGDKGNRVLIPRYYRNKWNIPVKQDVSSRKIKIENYYKLKNIDNKKLLEMENYRSKQKEEELIEKAKLEQNYIDNLIPKL